MYTHTSFGFCVVFTDHKQWFPEWANKPFLNKCTCARFVFVFFFCKIAALSPCHTVHLLKKNVTHKTRRNVAMIPYAQCDHLIPYKTL